MATPPPPPFSIRPAVYAELPTLARISTLAFWNDVLFGQLIHPHREQYPEDNDLYWLRRMRVDWWDWSQIFLVAVQQEEGMEGEGGKRKEVLVGTAHWVRIAEPGENRRAGWGLRWGDVREWMVLLVICVIWFFCNRPVVVRQAQLLLIICGLSSTPCHLFQPAHPAVSYRNSLASFLTTH
jgi:hypothetical protein